MADQTSPAPRTGSDRVIDLWPSGAAFAVLGLAVVASWQLRSAFTVGLVAFLAVILFALVEIDLSSRLSRRREERPPKSEQVVRDVEPAARKLAVTEAPPSEGSDRQSADAEAQNVAAAGRRRVSWRAQNHLRRQR